MPLVRDIMTCPVRTVRRDAPLTEVLQLMEQGGFRHVPVVDEAGRLVGILTDRDLAHRATGPMGFLEARERNEALAAIEIYEVMTDDPLTVPPTASLPEAARLMMDHRISSLPVVDHGAVLGLVTATDFLRHIAAT